MAVCANTPMLLGVVRLVGIVVVFVLQLLLLMRPNHKYGECLTLQVMIDLRTTKGPGTVDAVAGRLDELFSSAAKAERILGVPIHKIFPYERVSGSSAVIVVFLVHLQW